MALKYPLAAIWVRGSIRTKIPPRYGAAADLIYVVFPLKHDTATESFLRGMEQCGTAHRVRSKCCCT